MRESGCVPDVRVPTLALHVPSPRVPDVRVPGAYWRYAPNLIGAARQIFGFGNRREFLLLIFALQPIT